MSPEYRRLFMQRSEIALSRLVPQDATWLETWLNDPVTTKWMATGRVPTSVEQAATQIMVWQEPKDWPFAVLINKRHEQEDQFQAIGTVGLYDADPITRKAEFRILIGHPFTGKGYGTEATKLMLQFGFARLGLQRIWLGVTDANIPAVKCYERCGFIREGVLRRDLFRDGHFYNSIRMSVLDDEYRAKEPALCLTDAEKHPETLEPGPATVPPAGVPWTGFSPLAGG